MGGHIKAFWSLLNHSRITYPDVHSVANLRTNEVHNFGKRAQNLRAEIMPALFTCCVRTNTVCTRITQNL